MISEGYLVDGSWKLRVFVTDLQAERTLRVKGDLHVGGVMLKLVEDLDIAMDWSDHALWWPKRNAWLTKTRFTLDQYGVQADALLHFTPMHKMLRVQLPDLRYLDARVDFSIKTFNAVLNLCQELGIRHAEELSFCKPLEPRHLKTNFKDLKEKKKNGEKVQNWNDTNTFIKNESVNGSNGSLNSPGYLCAPISPPSPPPSSQRLLTSTPIGSPLIPGGTWKRNQSPQLFTDTLVSSQSMSSDVLDGGLDSSLAHSPTTPTLEAKSRLLRPKSLVERARLNVAWLDSSLSVMEQGVKEFDTLNLRFKFYCFYDLNPKHDAVRINQIYEQAKWQLLNEEIDCTEEEMLMFAALQVQITIQADQPQGLHDALSGIGSGTGGGDDDIDAALTDLQVTLEGSSINSHSPTNITHVPELSDYLRFLKPKRFTMKSYKRYWVTCRDLQLRLYRSQEESVSGAEPQLIVSLRGCEINPDVHLAHSRFGIKLEVASAEGMSEMWLRCDSEEQYAKWMAACRLASKGRSLADSSYEAEVRELLGILRLQRPAPAAVSTLTAQDLNLVPEDYIAPRFLKRFKGKLMQRILEAHANVKDLPLMEAKMSFIRAWQGLPEYGISLFVISFMGHKKEELLGVTFNRLMRMDINSGDHLKTWHYRSVLAWNVNWEVKHMMIQHKEGNIVFNCHSADCKVIHEFIGGYIFLSMRSKDANQTLNEQLFHKLTGGWA